LELVGYEMFKLGYVYFSTLYFTIQKICLDGPSSATQNTTL